MRLLSFKVHQAPGSTFSPLLRPLLSITTSDPLLLFSLISSPVPLPPRLLPVLSLTDYNKDLCQATDPLDKHLCSFLSIEIRKAQFCGSHWIRRGEDSSRQLEEAQNS